MFSDKDYIKSDARFWQYGHVNNTKTFNLRAWDAFWFLWICIHLFYQCFRVFTSWLSLFLDILFFDGILNGIVVFYILFLILYY